MQKIKGSVLSILKRNLELGEEEPLELDDDLLLLGINSINFIRIVVDFETEFGFEFGEEELDYNLFRTAGKLIEYIEHKLEGVA
ncbi:phosphopantetheine-binding protein [Paenibacillus sp. FSL P2-0136]|uniref:phosphopantetheine-binding protein n=1 Tax=unclassified Paenibacillus TaxID=185978 RepID=UPI0030D85765